MYTIQDYGRMIADRVRVDAYTEAMKRTIRAGDVVIDLGTGTGYFALLACKLGASRVHAIESNDAIHLARDLARDNGFADRIVFHHAKSTDVTLDERARVIVSDLRGVSPLHAGHLDALRDARSRMLAADGVLLPGWDRLLCAPIDAAERYERVVGPWEGASLSLDRARAIAVNTFHTDRDDPIAPDDIAAGAQAWADLHYDAMIPAAVSGSCSWTVDVARAVHGFALWFETELIAGVGFSSAPTADPRHARVYGRGFLPLERPLALAAGDTLTVALVAQKTANDYVWAWTTTHGKERFTQSTFLSELARPAPRPNPTK